MPGRLITKFREAKGLSQEDMMELLHMSQSNYSKIENNKIELTASVARKISKILGCTLDDIIPDDSVIESASLPKAKKSISSNVTIEEIDSLLQCRFTELKLWLEEKLNQHSK